MEFNLSPYYDDFKQNAKDNNYLRVLFKPGYAVQARELTTLQSMLQNQIKQFGDHIFQDGSPVIGGNLTLDNKATYIKLLPQYNNVDIDINEFDGVIVRNNSGTVQAKVLDTYSQNENEPVLIVRYLTGTRFVDGDVLKIQGSTTFAQLIASNASGPSTVVSINEGVFYINGFFVQVGNQSVVASPFDTSANVKVGLEISDDYVDSVVDTTLLDPAQESFNYQAPGADRYQISLTLSTRPLDAIIDESQFFELMRLEEGSITKQVRYPIYAELEKTLARRTFDESGDYTVAPFRATLQQAADANNYLIALEPGKAYVKGFEFETLGTVKMEADKPRSASDIRSLVDTDVDISYGNFIYVTSIRGSSNGFINIAALEKVDVHLAQTSNVTATGTHSGTANAFFIANTRIGTARVRNFVRYSADSFGTDSANVDSGGVYKLYLTDINIEPLTVKVNIASSNANTLRFNDKMSPNTNVYNNVSITILPIRLDAVPNVNVANVFINSYRLNANSTVANVFNGNVNVGSVIHVAGMVREVVSVNTIGDYLTVNTAWTQTFNATDKDSDPLEVYIQSSYSQNVSEQTRTIVRYDGPTRTVFLDRNFDNGGIPDANTVVSFNYHFDHAESIVAGPLVGNSRATVANASMNVALNSKYLGGETAIEDTLKKGLIYKLPGAYIQRASLENTDYNHVKYIPNRGNNATAGVFALSEGDGLITGAESIPWADTTSSIQQNLIMIVRDNNGNTYFPNGSIIQLTAANVTIGSPSTSLTVNTNVPDILKTDILVVVKENNAEDSIRIKNKIQNTSFAATSSSFTYPTAVNGNTTVTLPTYGTVANINVANGLIFLTDPTYNSVRPGDAINLFVPDVIRVRKVLKGNTTNLPDANNYTDITDHFLVDYGQRDDLYDHAQLILKEGYDVANAQLTVHVDFYQHIYNTTNTSFFSVDSYTQTEYENGTIPVYVSSTGTTFNLRDCLDFRPTRQLGSATGAFQNPYIPSPDEVSELSFNYYLPRIDKLVLSKDKEFRIIKGRSAPQPLPPPDIDDAMTLYTISLPPYVANINEIKLKYKENRRFTMKDISSMEKRLQKVEFFTSLNNVENLALSDPTEYEDGTQKEKYGVVGENFRNFNIADYRSRDFKVSLNNGFMLPAVDSAPFGLKNIQNSTTKVNKKTLTLNYTETPAISQNVCSNNSVSVQPFLFGSFNGILELTPETDYWVSEVLKPEIISVPERVIEHHHVVREIVKEPPPPVTINNYYPTTNVINQIILTPDTDPPAANANDNVVVVAPEPPPYIPPEPVPCDPYDWDKFVYCPAPWMTIKLHDDSVIPAGELKVGMKVKTYHEETLELGEYEVSHVESIQDAARLQIEFEHVDFVCSPDHKFYQSSSNSWIEAKYLKVGDRVGLEPNEWASVLGITEFAPGEVIKITVDDAHTYICEGLLSHNKLPSNPPGWPFLEPPIVIEPPTVNIPEEVIVTPPPFDPPIMWEGVPIEMPWINVPVTPVSFGSFDGNNFFPVNMIDFDIQPVLDIQPFYVPADNPFTTNPIVLGTSPLDELNYQQPVIAPSDVARDDYIGRTGGGGRADLDFGLFNYDLN